jgi:glycosyltransferase involved in cell wall biosynthesis
MQKHASLCLLAYKRPEQLKKCIKSLKDTADYPYTLIINVDGADSECQSIAFNFLELGEVSHVICTGSNNRGVGRSFQNCLGVAEGDFIFKIDTDLTFEHGWLSRAVEILENNRDIGAISLFDYNHYDPNDERFSPSANHLQVREDCIVVKDFVSSIFGFRNMVLPEIIPDDGLHQTIASRFGSGLAITKQDYVKNSGFGVGKSVYVSGTPENPYKTPTHDEPLIFLSGLKA